MDIQPMCSQLEEIGCGKLKYEGRVSNSHRIAGFSPLIVVLFLAVSFPSLANATPRTDQPRRILILNSYHKGFKWTDDEVRGAKAVLLKEIKDIEIYIKYLDTKRIRSKDYLQLFKQMLQMKYDKVQLDAVIATDDNALSFLLKYHKEPFGEVSVVFCGVNDFEDSMHIIFDDQLGKWNYHAVAPDYHLPSSFSRRAITSANCC